jgi:hypothetical protein
MDIINAKNKIRRMSDNNNRVEYENMLKEEYRQIYYTINSHIPFTNEPLHTASCKFLYYGALKYDKFSIPTPNACDEEDFTMFKKMVNALSITEGKNSLCVPTLKLHILKWEIYNTFNLKFIDETSKKMIIEYQKELSTINLALGNSEKSREFNDQKENISKILLGLESNSFYTKIATELPYIFLKKETKINFETDRILFKIKITPKYLKSEDRLIKTTTNYIVDISGASRWQNGISIIEITIKSLIDDSKSMPSLILNQEDDLTPIENWNYLFTLTYNIIEKIWWNFKELNIETSNWAPVPKDIPSITFSQCVKDGQVGYKVITNPSNTYKIHPKESDNNLYNLEELKNVKWTKKCKMYANIYAETGQYKESLFWLNVAVESLISDLVNSIVDDKIVLRELLNGVNTFESAEEILVKQFPTMKGKVKWPHSQKHPSIYYLIDKALLHSKTSLSAKEIKKNYSIINANRNDLFHGNNIIIQVEKLREAFNAYNLLYNKFLPFIKMDL